jgi:hypothetical protein
MPKPPKKQRNPQNPSKEKPDKPPKTAPPLGTTWKMWAHKVQTKYGTEFHHPGEKWWVKLHGLSEPIVPVIVTVSNQGTYYGWFDTEVENPPKDQTPSLIQPNKNLFDMCFPYKPEVEVERGKGHILRLHIEEASAVLKE